MNGMSAEDEAAFVERWKAEHVGTHPVYVLPEVVHEVSQRSTVDITGAKEALVVGPTDVLVILFPADTELDDLYAMRDRLKDSDLRDGQMLLIAGAEKIVKVQRDDDGGRPYARPHRTIDGGS